VGLRSAVNKAPWGAFLFGLLLGLAAAAPAGEPVQARKVLDGDTLILGDGRHLRLMGINAPELGRDGGTDQPQAAAARERLVELTRGHDLLLLPGGEPRDRYGRLLGRLERPGQPDLRETLVAEGLAWVVALPPNLDGLERLQAAEARARAARRGIWNEPGLAARDAGRMTPGDTGFRLVHGTVTRVGMSRKYHYVDLGPAFSIMIDRRDWREHFRGRPEALVGRTLTARGWVTTIDGKLRLKIRHPAMWDIDGA
jgi:micrococcal nuclease